MGEGENSPKGFKRNKAFSIPNKCDGLTNYKFVGDRIIYIASIEQDISKMIIRKNGDIRMNNVRYIAKKCSTLKRKQRTA